MIRDDNGKARPPIGSDSPGDPDEIFPLREDFCDCCGERLWFVISLEVTELGYAVTATEEGKEHIGYYFRQFDAHSPFLALGRLRQRMQPALATRHLQELTPGAFGSLHDTLRGRISYSSEEDEVAFIIDGRLLSLAQFAKIVETHEGWQFRLDFFDPSDDVPWASEEQSVKGVTPIHGLNRSSEEAEQRSFDLRTTNLSDGRKDA